MQLLLAPFLDMPVSLLAFGLATLAAALIVFAFLRAAASAESDRPSALRTFFRRRNSRVIFLALLLTWALVFGIGLHLVPHEGANSPYGGLAFVAMFSGLFIMGGLVWAVIGE